MNLHDRMSQRLKLRDLRPVLSVMEIGMASTLPRG